MPTTTIRLPEALKTKVAKAAARAGSTPHSFIVEAIMEKTEQANRWADFVDVAEQRYAKILATGKAVPFEEFRHYMKQRIAGKKIARPKARAI